MSSYSCFSCHIGYYYYHHEEIKKNKAKHEKNLTAFICQNFGVHPESTERDSPPFHEYVGISRDTSLYISILFTHCCILYVCMQM